MVAGVQRHISLDGLPHVKNLPAAKRPNVMNAFEEHGVFQALEREIEVLASLRHTNVVT